MDRIINPTLDSAKTGVATLITALVHTISETDPTFKDRFLKRLEQAAYSRKNSDSPSDLDEMEVIRWTETFITGKDWVAGEGKSLFTGD